jgi:hypothetical protein
MRTYRTSESSCNEQSEIRRGYETLSSNTIILQKSKVQHMFNHNLKKSQGKKNS